MNTSQKAMFYNAFFHCFLVFSLLEIDVSSSGVNTRRMFSSYVYIYVYWSFSQLCQSRQLVHVMLYSEKHFGYSECL